MAFSDTTDNLRIELDTHNCEFSPGQIREFERALDPLRKPVEKFPVSDLYVTVTYQPRSASYRITTTLVLSGRTLAAGDIDEQVYPPFERCVWKLLRKLEGYEADLGSEEALHKHLQGTRHDVIAMHEPNLEDLDEAVFDNDYQEFRTLLGGFDEPLVLRIGRWIQRYPETEARLGVDFFLSDLVEEVYLNAFERWTERPKQVRFGNWLEQLIDPSIRLLVEHPSQELENIELVRLARQG